MKPMSRVRGAAVVGAAFFLALGARPGSAQEAAAPADLILRNGNIVTLDDRSPRAEAIAIRGDRIVVVGNDAVVAPLRGPRTKVVDLGGRLTIPGFIEGHGHYMGLGRARTILDLTKPRNWDELVAMVEAAAAEAAPGEWIYGRGWHQEKWDRQPAGMVDGVPTHAALSAVTPENPVLLTHASGHAGFANAKALELAGITAATADPDGGTIVRDASGAPTGLLRETAQNLVGRASEQAESGRSLNELEPLLRRQALLAAEEALSKGVTSFHDAGVSFETVDFYRKLADEGALPVRLYVMLREPAAELDQKAAAYRTIGYGNNHLTVRAIKKSIDGALGSHGAWLLEPYSDMPGTAGLNTTSLEEMRHTAEVALRHGFQLATHAIGDRANRETLDIYEQAFAHASDDAERRWRIEHAQHVHPDDVKRFRELGVIASMQGIHATSDGPWVPVRLGEPRAGDESYLWRSFLDAGVVVTNGTDVPVEDIAPLASFYASVSRRMNNGERFHPGQRMTRMQALRSYTSANAFAAFEEDIKGSLTAGKLADIVVLSQDILSVPEEEIPNTRVDMTIVGGRVLYERE